MEGQQQKRDVLVQVLLKVDIKRGLYAQEIYWCKEFWRIKGFPRKENWAGKVRLSSERWQCVIKVCWKVSTKGTRSPLFKVAWHLCLVCVQTDKIPMILQDPITLTLSIELFSWKYRINAYIICFHFRFRHLVYFLFFLLIRHIDDLWQLLQWGQGLPLAQW